MFSGSKDCTVKVWDIHSGREIQSLEDHPDAVVKVRYNEYTRLAFSVSKSIIKVWDTRDNPARCIKTLKYVPTHYPPSLAILMVNKFFNRFTVLLV